MTYSRKKGYMYNRVGLVQKELNCVCNESPEVVTGHLECSILGDWRLGWELIDKIPCCFFIFYIEYDTKITNIYQSRYATHQNATYPSPANPSIILIRRIIIPPSLPLHVPNLPLPHKHITPRTPLLALPPTSHFPLLIANCPNRPGMLIPRICAALKSKTPLDLQT